MKSHSLLFAFFVSTPLLGTAQTQAGATTGPATTTTSAVGSPYASPNRQQELYDQYHGIGRRSRREPTTAAGSTSRTAPETPSPQIRPERPAGAERSGRPPHTIGRPARVTPVVFSTSAVRIGFRGGITYPFYLETLTGANLNPALGFTGGIVFQFGTGTVLFQPEINYTRNAYKLNQTDPFGGAPAISQRYGSDFVEIPLLLKIASGRLNSSRFFVNVGPCASYLLSTSIEGKTQSLGGTGGRFGIGAAAGVGAALKAGPGHLTAEARGLYFLGDKGRGVYTGSKAVQSQFTLGYVVPMGGR